jgi:long-chain acyl-CoA synthetase
MKRILGSIAHFAEQRPHQTALSDGTRILSYRELQNEIERLAAVLYMKRVGLLLENSCAWAAIDLAIQHRGAACVPLPSFFSDNQLRHVIANAGLDLIVTDQAPRLHKILNTAFTMELTVAGKKLDCLVITAAEKTALPAQSTKITYTSGTTGQPKGVCLTGESVERVALSLSDAVGAGIEDKSLSLLPLSTLLANIGGLYAPLYSGSIAYVPSLAECGMSGSTGVQPDLFIAALHRFQPTVTILVPQLLKILVEAATRGASLPSSLRFIAVGGAPAAPGLIARARDLGLPVFQGYGLSEAASVVSINIPAQDHIGSVGRPLPHTAVRIADDDEIMVSGNLFNGYLGQALRSEDEWPTGDPGFIDDDGYLHITGRKKTAFATAHGRKLNPEWIESELTASPAIAQAALFGEARSFNIAVIVPSSAAAVIKTGAAISTLNQTLPDYARVTSWIIADEPFSVRNGLANGAGAPDRQAIAAKYSTQIERLYQRESAHAVL